MRLYRKEFNEFHQLLVYFAVHSRATGHCSLPKQPEVIRFRLQTLKMMTKALLLLALMATSALCQTCDIDGNWSSSTNETAAGITTETDSTFDFNSDGTYSLTADVTLTTTDTSCAFTVSADGNYTLSESDVLSTTVSSCSISDCDGTDGCSAFCDGDCTTSDVPVADQLTFASDCDSFTDVTGTYTKSGGLAWWAWVLIVLAVLIAIGLVVAVVAGVGFVLWKKKQSAGYDTFESA